MNAIEPLEEKRKRDDERSRKREELMIVVLSIAAISKIEEGASSLSLDDDVGINRPQSPISSFSA